MTTWSNVLIKINVKETNYVLIINVNAQVTGGGIRLHYIAVHFKKNSIIKFN